MEISICVKSNTGGYYDYDDCNLLLKKLNSEQMPYLPRVGEHLNILEYVERNSPRKEYHDYLVTEICHDIGEEPVDVIIYVVPIGRAIHVELVK